MQIQLLKGFEEIKLTYSYFGLQMQQNNHALSHIGYILNNVNPDLIIEFGTRTGGLSILLQLFCKNSGGRKFMTYDNDESEHVPLYKDLFSILEIDFRREDFTTDACINDIASEIKSSNRALLICDAAKALEFNLFCEYLKSGDVAMCHDYFHDSEEYNEAKKCGIWMSHECEYSQLKNSIEGFNMKQIGKDIFKQSAWGVFQKQ